MNLQEIELELKQCETDIVFENSVQGTLSEKIAALQLQLQELTGKKRDSIATVAKKRSRITELANMREKIKRDMLENEIMSETAQFVEDLMKDYPGWNTPNEAGLQIHDYQKADIVSAVHAFKSGFAGFMNANDMGLGKTMEAFLTLKALMALEENPRVLWLTKTSILKTGGTVREGQKWFPELKLVPVEGSMPAKEREAMFSLIKMTGMSVITNYETVRTTEALRDISWDYIVMDEVHKLKGGANPSGPTAVWQAVKDICENSKIIMLTGTPMVNRVPDMWAYLHIFDPERFPSLRSFENAYTAVQTIAWESKVVIDAEKLLNSALKGRVIRRSKLDPEVKLELPTITPYAEREKLLEMFPTQRKVYDQMKDQFFIWLEEQNPDEFFSATAIIAQLIRLRQINIWPVIDFKQKDPITGEEKTIKLDVRESSKIDEAMEDILNVEDQFVIFSSFNAPLFEIQRRCKEEGITCEVLAGETSKNLANMEKGFQDGTITVLCINNAMGEGLNLQKSDQWAGGASYVGFLDLWWNPARNDQCTDRVWRQGAKEPVTVIHYKNEDSVDQYLDMVIEEKYQSISGVTESQKLRPADWLKMLKGKV